MAQEKNQEIDIRAWVIRILKNWYWFVLSCLICGTLGGLSYFSKNKSFVVDSQIMLRSSDNENSVLSSSELMGMMGIGGSKNTEDEVAEQLKQWQPLLDSGKQVAFVVKKGALEFDKKVKYANENSMSREEIIKHIVEVSGEDVIVSTTGKASRELFEILFIKSLPPINF